MKYSNVYLDAFGYQLPPNILTSEELENRLGPVYDRLKLPYGRLELMSGIKQRRFWDAETKPSDGAIMAGKKALENAACLPGEIDCIIFTSVCRDMMEPASASFVHAGLGLKESCLVFDISNACLGFLNGMIMMANMIELGQIKKGLIVSGETAENLVESTVDALLADDTLTRKTIKPSFASLTIGSGAVALVMSPQAGDNSSGQLKGGVCRANTSHNDLCKGGNSNNNGTLMATDSEALLQRGVETASLAWQDFIAKMAWPPESISRFFCHQVGSAHAKLLFETLQLEPSKNFETIKELGNVGSVSAPITLAMGIEQGVMLPGQRAAILGIGSGINCLMLGIEW
jgi:3-oxoacyl-[acyl-carrier-protein] synthase III